MKPSFPLFSNVRASDWTIDSNTKRQVHEQVYQQFKFPEVLELVPSSCHAPWRWSHFQNFIEPAICQKTLFYTATPHHAWRHHQYFSYSMPILLVHQTILVWWCCSLSNHANFLGNLLHFRMKLQFNFQFECRRVATIIAATTLCSTQLWTAKWKCRLLPPITATDLTTLIVLRPKRFK